MFLSLFLGRTRTDQNSQQFKFHFDIMLEIANKKSKFKYVFYFKAIKLFFALLGICEYILQLSARIEANALFFNQYIGARP